MKLTLSPRKVFNFYKKLIRENKNWLFLTAGIFVCGSFSGLIVSLLLPSFAEDTLRNYSASIDRNVPLGWQLSWYVFQRNLALTTISSFLGVVFGIVPIFVTYINGVVLGVVFGFVPIQGVINPLQLLLLLLPHGVFEYTGTLLGTSFGLRLGINWLLDKKGKSRKEIFVDDLKRLVIAYPLVFILLLVAALIEGLVTINIACFFGGICQ